MSPCEKPTRAAKPSSRFLIVVRTFYRNEPFFGTKSLFCGMYPCINLAQLSCHFCSQRLALYSSWTSEYRSLFHSIARNLVNIISFPFAQDNVPNSCQCTSTCSTKAGRKRTGCPCKTAGRFCGEACSFSRRKPCKNREVGKQGSVEV